MEEYFVEEKTSYDKLLDFLVFIAVFIVTIFLLLEIFASAGIIGLDIISINEFYLYANIFFFIIFIADLIRLWKQSDGAKDFFKNNWLDVLATIPFGLIAQSLATFNNVFKIFRATKLVSTASKLQKASRISKISKEFKAASHLKKEGAEYEKKHRL